MAKIKNQQSLAEVFKSIANGITGVFVFIILVIFPLYTHNKYFDILGARYAFFKYWCIILCVLLSALGILYLILDTQNQASSPTALRRFLDAFKPKNIKNHIVITDIFFVVMIISMTISTIFSNYKEESFFGNAGRYQGLECWILYFISYIAITRTFKFKRVYLDFAILAGAFACVWGILDFFWLDPFHFFVDVSEGQQGMFASSIGNLNTYTNYTIMVFALTSALFMVETKTWRLIYYLIASLIASVGTIFGFADNAVLGFFGFFVALPFFVPKTRRSILRYFILIDVFLISLFFLYIGLKYPHNTWQGSFFQDLVKVDIIKYIFIPFTILIIGLFILFNKMAPRYSDNINNNLKPLDSILPKTVMYAYIVVLVIGFIVVGYILFDMNVTKQHVDLWRKIPSSHQLEFNDYWGTHRGHNWRIAFTNFTQNFSWFQRLFGYGPDTYLIVSERTFYEEMVERFGEVYDSAHNEYINYLICEGIIGLVSYLGIFISGLVVAIKNIKNNIYIIAPILAVIVYLVQAFVNIAIPITTPVFFTLMYIGVAEHFENKNKI